MDILTILKEFATHGQTSVFFGLAIVLVFVAKFFYKEYKKIVNEHKKDFATIKEKHEKNYEDIVKQMFDVINKNTESNTRLSEAVKDLSLGIHLKDK